MNLKLGILMDGGEEDFLWTVRQGMRRADCYPAYLEIGVAHGDTLKGVCDATRDLRARLFGIELAEWVGRKELDAKFKKEPLVTLIYEPSSKALAQWPNGELSVAFIDACHGYNCVCADFTAVEPHIATGGIDERRNRARSE